MDEYDIVVIGGGHAGIEASFSAAKLGCKVALVTMDLQAIGRMSCNPAIGGTAKGHLVREIDALGGAMGLLADRTGIQFRMLNRSKGPAVWSPRCQSDRKLYSLAAIEFLSNIENLTFLQNSIVRILVEDKKVLGVLTKDNKEIKCKAVILSSGTFLNGLMHTGLKSTAGGRFGEQSSNGLTESIVELGFETERLKTGTPPRLDKNSIDFSSLEEQPGDDNPQPFSFRTDISSFPYLPQVSCYITFTHEGVHKTLEKGFHESPMFTGLIKGKGPRYCPSIEDKIVRFAEKERHHLFLEPEGLDSDLIYLNGFSTSLPAPIQLEAIHQIKGLEEAVMVRPGYAVEYDFFPPHQVDLTLETKLIEGLYFAGQVNGTSGYEEAATQGLVAGINAARKVLGLPEFVLKRSEAYIGVLIDDLVTKSTDEPYRMFTSRAEHRLLLRQDNADRRLLNYGYELGLISKTHHDELNDQEELINRSVAQLREFKVHSRYMESFFSRKHFPLYEASESIAKICKRPDIELKELLNEIPDIPDEFNKLLSNYKALEQVEIELKYEGYIKRQVDMIDKFERYEDTQIPLTLNYFNLKSLSTEGKEKLNRIKPRSIGQASRISGVTPSDISVLLVYLKN